MRNVHADENDIMVASDLTDSHHVNVKSRISGDSSTRCGNLRSVWLDMQLSGGKEAYIGERSNIAIVDMVQTPLTKGKMHNI